MLLTAKERSLLDALEPEAEANGIEIVTIEIAGARKAPTIRVFIDTPDGVSFDALSTSQAWINAKMDELDPFPGAYTLEVSSPGIDRPLRTPRHFADAIGETVVIASSEPIGGRSKWTGELVAADDASATVEVEGTGTAIPFEKMKKAHVKGVIDFNAQN